MSSLKRRADGIIKLTPATDLTGKEGYGVTWSGDTATLGASASVHHRGIILEGGTVAEGVTVAILGAINGSVDVKLSGTVTRGDNLQQAADGTFVTDAGTGARVLNATADQSGVTGDLIPAFLRAPISLT